MQKIVIRVSDELLELIENPKLITASHYHCLWCGMVKAFPKKPCEICGLHGNTQNHVKRHNVFVTHKNSPATRKVRRVKRGSR